MKKLNFSTVLISELLLCLTICVSAQACDDGYIVGIGTGNCIRASGSCGSDCNYTIDSLGNLNISGNGSVGKTAFFYNKDIRNIVISEGITSIGPGAFEQSSVTSVKLPSTLRTVDYNAFAVSNLPNIVIPEGVRAIGAYAFMRTAISRMVIPQSVNSVISSTAVSGTVYCTAEQKAVGGACSSLGNALIYEKDGDNYISYDANGKIDKIFGSFEDLASNGEVISGSYTKKDENGKILGKYNGNGELLERYSYASDGSIAIYDKDGKLIGLQGKRILTVDEASALVKDNKNTFTLRYR